jgi:hypothetical protein
MWLFQGFEAIKGESKDNKPVNFWHLTDEAYEHGIQSTTHYRKANHRKGNHRKGSSSDITTRERRRSGSKGGKATKNAARMRNSPHYEHPTSHTPRSLGQPHRQLLRPPIRAPQGSASISPCQMSLGSTPSGLPSTNSSQNHAPDEVISCAAPPPGHHPVSYGTGGLESSALGMGQVGYYGPVYTHHGLSASHDTTTDLQFVWG